MPLPNPSFEPKTHRWRPAAVAPSREVPSEICAVLGQKQPFFAQDSPSKGSKQPNEGKRLLHCTCGLTFLRPRDLWCPLNPRYARETAQKGAKKPQKLRNVHQHPETKNGPYLGLRGSKNEYRGHLVHPQPTTFYGFQASESPNETRRPPYQWSVSAAGGPASPHTVGANGGSTRVPRAKKMIFSKVVPRPLGILEQVFLGRFEPVAARFGP